MNPAIIGYSVNRTKGEIEKVCQDALNMDCAGRTVVVLEQSVHALPHADHIAEGKVSKVCHSVCHVNDEGKEYQMVYTFAISFRKCSPFAGGMSRVVRDMGFRYEVWAEIYDETANPPYASYCPCHLLKMLTPPLDDNASKWRDNVRNAHRRVSDREYRLENTDTGEVIEMATAEVVCAVFGIPQSMFRNERRINAQRIGETVYCDNLALLRTA